MTTYRYYTISPRIDDTGKHYAAIYDAIKRPVTETIRCDNEAAAIQAAQNYIDSLLDGPVSKVDPELANDGLRQIVIEQNHDLAALRRQLAERDARIAELEAENAEHKQMFNNVIDILNRVREKIGTKKYGAMTLEIIDEFKVERLEGEVK